MTSTSFFCDEMRPSVLPVPSALSSLLLSLSTDTAAPAAFFHIHWDLRSSPRLLSRLSRWLAKRRCMVLNTSRRLRPSRTASCSVLRYSTTCSASARASATDQPAPPGLGRLGRFSFM